jgi:large subunit ribosomal protein L18
MKKSVPTIPFRRKREQKTNYRKRIALLKSGKSRLVIRLSNKYVKTQIINYEAKGDKIIKSAISPELKKLGWTFSCKNIPACYLTGLLIANKMKAEKNKEFVVDFGLRIPLKGNNKLYAVLRGAIDNGLNIPANSEVFPTDEVVFAKNKSEEMQKVFEKIKTELIK